MNSQPSVKVLVSHQLLHDVLTNNKGGTDRSKTHKDLFEAITQQNNVHVKYTKRIEHQIFVKVSRFLKKNTTIDLKVEVKKQNILTGLKKWMIGNSKFCIQNTKRTKLLGITKS